MRDEVGGGRSRRYVRNRVTRRGLLHGTGMAELSDTDLREAGDFAAQAEASARGGDHAGAARLWARARARAPANADYFIALTRSLVSAGDPGAALDACDAAETDLQRPVFAQLRRGQILYHDLARPDAARACFEGVLAVESANAAAHYGLARIAFDRLDMDLARRHAALALGGVDNLAALWLLIWVLGDYTAAITLSDRLLADNPGHVELLVTRARAFYLMRRYDEALASFARAAEHDPHRMGVGFGLAELLLMVGDSKAGWRWFDSLVTEDLLQAVRPEVRPSLETYWQGQSLKGKHILVVHFLGIGDNIMMARFARELKARGAHVTFCCRPELYRLFENLAGVDDLRDSYDEEPWGNFDYWSFDYTLPRWLGASENAIPAFPEGYVDRPAPTPGVERVPGRLRVGLCWCSAPVHFTGASRFVPPEAFAPLADLQGVDWFVVQKGPFNPGFAARSGLFTMDPSHAWTDFRDTAAFMATLDLVISIDSSPLHLAGALGIPAWGLICAAPDWKWGLAEASPWYPQIRLFRQGRLDDWAPVIQEVRAALEMWGLTPDSCGRVTMNSPRDNSAAP